MKPFDSRGDFRPTEKTSSGVVRLAVRGAGSTLIASGSGLAIQVIATIVLARQLAPRDFGAVAMVTTFSLLLMNFGLNGFTEAVVQRSELDNGLASNLFWINLGAGLLLTGAFAATGSLLAWFYHNPDVSRIAFLISPSIFITSASVLHLALLKRAMRFSSVSANDVVARAASVGTSIFLAWRGWGSSALVAGAIMLPLSTCVGSWILCQWIPRLPRRVAGTGAMVGFAFNVYGHFTVNYFSRNVDNLLVGWRFNALALGFYKKAYDLFALSGSQLVSPLSVVAVSALRRFTSNPSEYRRYVLNAVGVTAFVGMAVGANLTLIGRDLIRVLLGPGWEPAGKIFTYFGPGIGVMLVYHTHGWIHLSIGKADRWLRWGIVEFVFTVLLFILGLHWGPNGIAVAWTASFWLLLFPAFWYAGQPIGLGVGPVLVSVWKYVAPSLVASGISAFVIREIPLYALDGGGVEQALIRIASISVLFWALYLGGVIIMHRGFGPLRQVWSLMLDMIPWDFGFKASPVLAAVSLANETPQNQSSKPLVSVLIPAYNAERWIADTLRSALGQTWERIEVIVVDDGSTDKTLEVARRFESETVKVVTQRSLGAAAARNLAFSLSKGDFIQWLDADDILASDKISRQMEVMEQCQGKWTLLSSAWGQFLHRPYRAKFIPTALWCDLSPLEFLLRKMGENLYMQTATWLAPRALVEAAGPWDTRLLSDDDGEFFCRVLLASEGVRFVPEAKVYYRGPGLAFRSLSYMGQSERKLDALWISMKLHIRCLRSLEDSPRVREACVRYMQASLIYFFPNKVEVVKEAEEMAREMGGELDPPQLSWKYSWVKSLFGWESAHRFRLFLLGLRWTAHRSWDQTLYSFRMSLPGANSAIPRRLAGGGRPTLDAPGSHGAP